MREPEWPVDLVYIDAVVLNGLNAIGNFQDLLHRAPGSNHGVGLT